MMIQIYLYALLKKYANVYLIITVYGVCLLFLDVLLHLINELYIY